MKIKPLLASLSVIASILTVALFSAQFKEPTVRANCVQRSPINSRACQRLEEKALNSTVRILLQSWIVKPGEAGYDIQNSVGHGTVMEGRYLVTHNHFDFPLYVRPAAESSESYVVIYLYDSNGKQLFKGPLSEFDLVEEDAETLVFAHQDERFFEKLGFESADFQSWISLQLEEGMTVAQIDWDGERTRVDWVKVTAVILGQGTPRLVLADDVLPGASGGGIFWNGVHVANNWRMEQSIGVTGEVIGAVTTVALNSAGVLNH